MLFFFQRAWCFCVLSNFIRNMPTEIVLGSLGLMTHKKITKAFWPSKHSFCFFLSCLSSYLENHIKYHHQWSSLCWCYRCSIQIVNQNIMSKATKMIVMKKEILCPIWPIVSSFTGLVSELLSKWYEIYHMGNNAFRAHSKTTPKRCIKPPIWKSQKWTALKFLTSQI